MTSCSIVVTKEGYDKSLFVVLLVLGHQLAWAKMLMAAGDGEVRSNHWTIKCVTATSPQMSIAPRV
jgi:hypothetical protein